MKNLDKLCLSTEWGVKGALPPKRPAACEDTQPSVAKTHARRAPEARASRRRPLGREWCSSPARGLWPHSPLSRGPGGKRAREYRRRQGSEVFARARIYLDYIDAFSDTVRRTARCA